jgi:hypothetical protein
MASKKESGNETEATVCESVVSDSLMFTQFIIFEIASWKSGNDFAILCFFVSIEDAFFWGAEQSK